MTQPRSIRFRLSLVFMFFLILVVVLGLFSIGRLHDLNTVSEDIQERWLPNTRYLGDLNNYTSDFRAAEATHLVAEKPDRVAATEKEIEVLDQAVSLAQRGYESIYHDDREAVLYRQFSRQWAAYRASAEHVLTLSRAGNRSEAVEAYMTSSRKAYDAASDTLGMLTDRNVANAGEASERASRTYWQARALIDAAILVAGLMVAGAIWYVRRSISKPLLAITTAMRHLADNETDIDIPGTKRGDEIGEMARMVRVFRNNAVDLALSRHGLVQQASMLAEKLEQEQKLTALQRNFVSMASHEFRTPLGIIDGHVQRLVRMKDRLPPEELAERAEKIRSTILQMTSLIDNLLGTARLFEGDASLYFHPAPMDLAKLLHDVCHMHREIRPDALIVEKIDALSQITGDAKLLQQAFSNLLSNAVKYSPDGGAITVSATSDATHVTVTVEDSGVGIPEKDIMRLFEQYFRASNVSGITGTGVGLYLVKMVTELHGGTVSVASIEGRGSCFTVRLPQAA